MSAGGPETFVCHHLVADAAREGAQRALDVISSGACRQTYYRINSRADISPLMIAFSRVLADWCRAQGIEVR